MAIEICAEAGVNHNGDVDTALHMIDAAAAAGVDIVKFQTYSPEHAIHPNHKDYALLSKLALSHKDFIRLAKHCEQMRVEFLSTPGDLVSLKFLVEEIGVKRIKIGSDDLTFLPLIREAAKTKLPLILSTGMATFTEINRALFEIYEVTGNLIDANLTLLHCVSAYPCRIEDVNLRAIETLQRVYRKPIGYSDHTSGTLACLAAAALGAVFIEKHFMIFWQEAVDAEVSIYESELEKMVSGIRTIEKMLGNGEKVPCEDEKKLMPLVRKRADGRKFA